MLSVLIVMLRVIMLSVIMLIVIILSVAAPYLYLVIGISVSGGSVTMPSKAFWLKA